MKRSTSSSSLSCGSAGCLARARELVREPQRGAGDGADRLGDQLALGRLLGLALGERGRLGPRDREVLVGERGRARLAGAIAASRGDSVPSASSTAGHSSANASRRAARPCAARRRRPRSGRRRGDRGRRRPRRRRARRAASGGCGACGVGGSAAARRHARAPAAVAGSAGSRGGGAAPARRRALEPLDPRQQRLGRRVVRRLGGLDSASSSWVRASAPSFIARRRGGDQVEQADDVDRARRAAPARPAARPARA